MKKIIAFLKKVYQHFMNDSLYRNSIYLILSTAVMAFFGFFFWIIVTRLYKTDHIGNATTLISAASLITNFSLLGIGQSLIRYLHNIENKNKMINTSFTVVAICAIVIGFIFIMVIPIFFPKLNFLHDNIYSGIVFIIFMPIYALNTLSDSVFIAYRSAKYVLIYDFFLSITKLFLPFLLISLGSIGIFYSITAGVFVAFIWTFYFLYSKFHYIYFPTLNLNILNKILKFSLGNYLSNFLSSLPSLYLPILITNNLNSKITAYFYIDMMIANLIYVIPLSISQSLFAEGSINPKNMDTYLKRTLKITFVILIPIIIVALFFSKYILRVFGKNYETNGIMFLEMLVLSSIFLSINYIFGARLKINNKIKKLVILNILNAFFILFFSELFIKSNLVGIGFSWIIGQSVISVFYLFDYFFL